MALSALVHLWFAAGTTVDATAPPAPHGQMITARLESSVTPSTSPLKLQTETGGAEKNTRQDARPRGRSVHDSGPKSFATNRSSAPTSEAGAPGTRTADPALPRPADPVYYPARQLDVYPALLRPVRPDYPEQPSQNKTSGKVLMTLLIDETGSVNEVSMVDAEPAGYFEDTVRRAFARARFSPARKDGHAVKSRVLISVTYNPPETEGIAR